MVYMPKYVCGGGGVDCFFILGVLVEKSPPQTLPNFFHP